MVYTKLDYTKPEPQERVLTPTEIIWTDCPSHGALRGEATIDLPDRDGPFGACPSCGNIVPARVVKYIKAGSHERNGPCGMSCAIGHALCSCLCGGRCHGRGRCECGEAWVDPKLP